MPFFRSFVVATRLSWVLPDQVSAAAALSQDQQLLGRAGEELRSVVSRHEGVLDPDAPPARQVYARLDGDRNSIL
jgi:hypothetical protein